MTLELNNVTYQYQNKYRTVRVINGISQVFEPGRFYAIIGKSGSGKTTLLSLMAGLRLPLDGTVSVDGVSMTELDRGTLRRDRISVIYQDYNLFPLLTMEENAAYPLRLRGGSDKDGQEIAREKLRMVDLREDQFKRLPNMLSGGEQQRVAIARALVTGSELILADEPTGNLDSENSHNIVGILKNLAHDQQRCVVIVTHDSSVSEEADVILKMSDGKFENA